MLIELPILEKLWLKPKTLVLFSTFIQEQSNQLPSPSDKDVHFLIPQSMELMMWIFLSLNTLSLLMLYIHSMKYNIQFLFPWAAPSWGAVLGHTWYGALSRRSRSYTVILIFFLYSRITEEIKLVSSYLFNKNTSRSTSSI